MAVTETDLAWLAGIVDGEGSLQLRARARSFTPRLTIGNTSRAIMDRVQTLFDILGVCGHTGVAARQRRPMGIAVLQGEQAVTVVQAVRPYLIGKAEQADILLEYHTWRKQQPKNLGGRQAFPEEFHIKREDFHRRITEPKHRHDYSGGDITWQ